MSNKQDPKNKPVDSESGGGAGEPVEAGNASAEEPLANDLTQEPKANDCCNNCTQYLDGWKRALADYENLKKEAEKARMESGKWARISVVQDLIPILDNFDLAVAFAPQDTENVDGFAKGVRSIKKQLEALVETYGAEAYGVVGDVFDANLHESIGETNNTDLDDEVIADVQQRGWRINNKILRPAKVIINNKQ